LRDLDVCRSGLKVRKEEGAVREERLNPFQHVKGNVGSFELEKETINPNRVESFANVNETTGVVLLFREGFLDEVEKIEDVVSGVTVGSKAELLFGEELGIVEKLIEATMEKIFVESR
jgi:hypothetical protein